MPSSSTAYPQAPFAVVRIATSSKTHFSLVWGHGWGQSSAALLPLAEALKPFAESLVIDFPGFGDSAAPPETWGTGEYADAVAEWLGSMAERQFIWVGHSFGGRVGLQLAARHPELLRGMVLIAAAGLPRKRPFLQKTQFAMRRYLFKAAKLVLRGGPQLDRLRQRMGSADYRSAGAIRPIFTRVVNEDLTAVARVIRCPTLLIYGQQDTETPPEIGERLQGLIQGSNLTVLEGFGHLDILTSGRHQVAARIRSFLESLPQ